MTDFFIRMKLQIDLLQPFVVYRKPDQNSITGYFQKNDHLYFIDDFTEKGFVFAPFKGETIICFPESECDIQTAGWFDKNDIGTKKNFPASDSDRETFIEMVKNAVEAIEIRKFEKVVLSRRESIALNSFDPISTFQDLLSTYTSAFVYCWYHPKIGMWFGATPEQLVRTENSRFFSVALAGTQKFTGNIKVSWPEKEQLEQRFVTDYIIENLTDICSEIVVSSPYTARAGNLLHIKTDLEGSFKSGFTLKDAIKMLHPTPAVCGMPRNDALDYILRNENYDREYYTGYLGEINKEVDSTLKSDLFVNLRCMKIENLTAQIFVGCGITVDSDPEKEYFETVEKSKTMKKIL